MGCPDELRPDMSVTDIAYVILKRRGKATHFKELIDEILKVKPMGQENPGRLLAQIHTEINLDSRFIHLGNGEWGLRDWQPKGGTKVIRIRTTPAPVSRPRPELLPEDEYDELLDEEEDLLAEPDEEEDDLYGFDRDDDFERELGRELGRKLRDLDDEDEE